ncbi:hypothetical protein ESA94_16340 [Lacibacter luteus]|uniref:Outer membrane protein beta-barrel domain-containing protein n=1 Tax=Lacibacter luteus TaxID=2508719 RepID=A0A4Q1CFZ9_9BACT|nr:hypothetical protein [Lacibacter luteus]RXK58953.1 hypothetical protein ESA94_16340 [Lacibacter luteus]
MMKKILCICICMVIINAARSQVYVQAGGGITTNGTGGGDLSIGYAAKKTTFSVGYFALIDNSEPLLLNVQGGYKINKAWRVYGGYVRKQVSANVKSMNTNSWLAGVEYNTKRFKKGNFYYAANYIPHYFFVTVGMKFNYK